MNATPLDNSLPTSTPSQRLITQSLDTMSANGNYERRAPQLHFMSQWDNLLTQREQHITHHSDTPFESHNVMLAELPTGSGKTIGALIPALAQLKLAKQADNDYRKIIYATSTVNLMQQVLYKDIPKILNGEHTKIKVEPAIGRGRYYCQRHANTVLHNAEFAQSDMLDAPQPVSVISPEEYDHLKTLNQHHHDGTWSGMRDDIPTELTVSDNAWRQVQSQAQTCNPSCQFRGDCGFINARERIEEADIVVCTHAMLFADLDKRALLPNIESSILIIDEADQCHANYRTTQQHSLHLHTLLHSVSGEQPWIAELVSLSRALDVERPPKQTEVDNTVDAIIQASEAIASHANNNIDHVHAQVSQIEAEKGLVNISAHGLLDTPLHTLCTQLHTPLATLTQWIDAILSEASQCDTLPASTEQRMLALAEHGKAVQQAKEGLSELIKVNYEEVSAVWLQRKQHDPHHISLHCCLINVSQMMREQLWEPAFATVLMSATLRALGSFNELYTKMGMQHKRTVEMHLPSPFDYSKSTLHLYPHFPSPNWRDERDHTYAMCEQVCHFMTYHQAGLVLFASKRQMNAFVMQLPDALKAIAIVQYSMSRENMIIEHKARIDAGKPSLLVGVTSMGIGIDLPKQYLTFLGIAKITFADASDPIGQTEHHDCYQRGGNPFMDLTLADASSRLVQAVGRLIRSPHCAGEVAIFDERLVNKRYGNTLMNQLPPFYLYYHYPVPVTPTAPPMAAPLSQVAS